MSGSRLIDEKGPGRVPGPLQVAESIGVIPSRTEPSGSEKGDDGVAVFPPQSFAVFWRIVLFVLVPAIFCCFGAYCSSVLVVVRVFLLLLFLLCCPCFLRSYLFWLLCFLFLGVLPCYFVPAIFCWLFEDLESHWNLRFQSLLLHILLFWCLIFCFLLVLVVSMFVFSICVVLYAFVVFLCYLLSCCFVIICFSWFIIFVFVFMVSSVSLCSTFCTLNLAVHSNIWSFSFGVICCMRFSSAPHTYTHTHTVTCHTYIFNYN